MIKKKYSIKNSAKREKSNHKIGLFVGTERGYESLKAISKHKVKISNVLILKQQKHEIRNFTEKIAQLCKNKSVCDFIFI